MREIERIIGKTFEHREVPTPDRIIEKQIYNLADRLERVEVNEDAIAKYFHGVERKLQWLDGGDLLKRLLSLEFNRLLDYYKDAPVIENVPLQKPAKPKKENRKPLTEEEKDRRTAPGGMARIYLSAGKRDGFYAGNLIDMLNHLVAGKRVDVGRIDLLPTYALFDVKKSDAGRIVAALNGADFVDKRLHCEKADPDRDYSRLTSPKGKKSAEKEPPFKKFRKR